MANLPTDYADDVLDVSKNTNRKYNMIENQDGTVSFEDVTQYQQEGTQYGAGDVNAQNREINALNSRLTLSLVDIDLKYDETDDKPYYRKRGADTWLPFKSVDSGSGHALSTGETITLGYRPSMVAVLINPNSQYWTVLIHDGTQSYASWAGQRIDLTDTGFYIWGGSYGSYTYTYMAM